MASRYRSAGVALLLVGVIGFATQVVPSLRAETAVKLPTPATDVAATNAEQVVVLAGGCFWGVQLIYQHTEGVIQAVSGYAGDTAATAKYDLVSTGKTKHAEAVEVRFDPRKITYGKILQIFFSVAHNPTELDRQGPDEGPQYRSAIFYGDGEQKRVAEAYIKQLTDAKLFRRPIVTRVDRLEAFYPAEAYHQDYATLNPRQPYIVYHDLPKLANLSRLMPEVWRAKPVLVSAKAKTN
jgi:peptide-methionine (S)-S-oxide reductase